MTIWIDAQLSPALAPWIKKNLGIEAFSARWLGLQYATDEEIFDKARKANAIVMTKDRDFVQLLNLHGPPPKVLWITSGNTSNARMKQILARTLKSALDLLRGGEQLVEITDRL